MKTIAPLLLLLSSFMSVSAQDTFTARLTRQVVPPDFPEWPPARADFTLDGSSASFVIRFGYEGIIPRTARLSGSGTNFDFALGPPFIVIHSPGGPDGWPDGYDGSTTFYGAFVLPDSLRNDFVNGRVTLRLLGSDVGDFTGAVLPPLEINHVASNVVLSWPAATTNFVLEAAATLAVPNAWATVTNTPVVIGNRNTVTDAASGGARFYRLKRL